MKTKDFSISFAPACPQLPRTCFNAPLLCPEPMSNSPYKTFVMTIFPNFGTPCIVHTTPILAIFEANFGFSIIITNSTDECLNKCIHHIERLLGIVTQKSDSKSMAKKVMKCRFYRFCRFFQNRKTWHCQVFSGFSDVDILISRKYSYSEVENFDLAYLVIFRRFWKSAFLMVWEGLVYQECIKFRSLQIWVDFW